MDFTTGFPGHYYNFNAYYSYAYTQFSRPGYYTTQTIVLLETNLYEVNTQELIWSMSSDTVEASSVVKLIESASRKVQASLEKDQLI